MVDLIIMYLLQVKVEIKHLEVSVIPKWFKMHGIDTHFQLHGFPQYINISVFKFHTQGGCDIAGLEGLVPLCF